MLWYFGFILSVAAFFLTAAVSLVVKCRRFKKGKSFRMFNVLFAGVFVSALAIFLPIHGDVLDGTLSGVHQMLFLSVFNAVQLFPTGAEFSIVSDEIHNCPELLRSVYLMWTTTLYVLAPMFTFGFVLSLFKNLSAYIRYLLAYFRDAYIFSELNEKSLTLASDLKMKDGHAVIVFTDVFEEEKEGTYELIEKAEAIGAICFKKDMLVIGFRHHSKKKTLAFFAIGENETENLNQGLKIIEAYRNHSVTNLYIFSTKFESELLLSSLDKGNVKVRRINEAQALINRILYEDGFRLFEEARETEDGTKEISALVIGLGRHGKEMVKALAWFGQMDGYRVSITGFDQDPLSKEEFIAGSPELMSSSYNGVYIDGEAQYLIDIKPNCNVKTKDFMDKIAEYKNATYVLVALGTDELNIKAAADLRMIFERMGTHPRIQAIVYNSEQQNALRNVENYKGQAYDIEFIGDIASAYTEEVIIDSELERAALKVHKKYGDEAGFWQYEYNYRSSMASAIHQSARIRCGIPGSDKYEEELTDAEREGIEVLEHRRWNAYMRAEGYIYSGSKEKASRNDLAKMHNNLTVYAELPDEIKRIDSRVGTK